MHDLVGAHGGVTDEDQLVVRRVAPDQVLQRDALGLAPAVVLPHALVDEVVEIEILEVLELGLAGAEQLLADLHVRIHAAADVEEQQHLHRVVPLRHHLDVEPARIARRRVDRVGQVEDVGGALAREPAQPAQRQLDVADAQLELVIEVGVFALLPHLHRALAAALAADAHAFRVVAGIAERRGAAGADPLAAALVALFLLGEALFEGFHQLVPAAHRLDLLAVFLGQVQLGHLLEPVQRHLAVDLAHCVLHALEVRGEGAVEAVVVGFVLHQRRARQEVEVLHREHRDVLRQRFEQRQVLGQADLEAGLAQGEEEGKQHGTF